MIHLLLLLLLTLALAHPHRVTIFVLFSYASLLVDAVLAWHAHGVSARLVGLLASIHRYPHCIGYGVMVYYDAGQRIACPLHSSSSCGRCSHLEEQAATLARKATRTG